MKTWLCAIIGFIRRLRSVPLTVVSPAAASPGQASGEQFIAPRVPRMRASDPCAAQARERDGALEVRCIRRVHSFVAVDAIPDLPKHAFGLPAMTQVGRSPAGVQSSLS